MKAARTAFGEWSALPPAAREKILLDGAMELERQSGRFEELLVEESGSVLGKARFEVGEALSLTHSLTAWLTH